MTRLHVKMVSLLAVAGLATAMLAVSSACSLLLHSDQCSTDGDCASKGATFGGTVCQRGFCVSLEDAGADAAVDDASASVEGGDADAAPLPGDRCENAVVVSIPATSMTTDAGTTLKAQDIAGYGANYTLGPGCIAAEEPDRVYSVVVPNGAELTVAFATPSFDGVLNVDSVDGPNNACATTLVCAVGAARGGTASYINPGGQPLPVFVVASSVGAKNGPFDLDFRIGSFPPGESCRNPIAIAAGGGTLAAQTTTGFANNYSPTAEGGAFACAAGAGADAVYTLAVPAGKTLTVTVTPSGPAWTASINLVAGGVLGAQSCDGAPLSCIASGRAAKPNGVATAQYANGADAADQSIFIVVDAVVPGESGAFTLSATIM